MQNSRSGVNGINFGDFRFCFCHLENIVCNFTSRLECYMLLVSFVSFCSYQRVTGELVGVLKIYINHKLYMIFHDNMIT